MEMSGNPEEVREEMLERSAKTYSTKFGDPQKYAMNPPALWGHLSNCRVSAHQVSHGFTCWSS